MSEITDDLEATAFHEAGHAVAARLAGHRVTSIQVTRGHQELGATGIEHWTVVSLMAGFAAETRYRGVPNPKGARRDFEAAIKMIVEEHLGDGSAPTTDAVQLRIAEAIVQAEALLDLHWAAVDALAHTTLGAPMRRLFEEEIEDVLGAHIPGLPPPSGDDTS